MSDNMFLESEEGVHVIHPHLGDFTLCGDSFDIGVTQDDAPSLKQTNKKVVTCPLCILIIKGCKNIKFKEAR